MLSASDQERDSGFIAFVSYAHRDGRWARWVHRALETYRLPGALTTARGGRRVGRLFLDRSELATSNSLSDRIEEALTGSMNLVLVCSPAARASRWVNEEVRRFRALGRGDRIFCLIVDGDPASDDEGSCFPPALLEAKSGEARPEPLAADVRPGKDKRGDARLKLVAGLLDLPFDALRRREALRRQRLFAVVAGISLALMAAMSGLAIYALIARAEAVRQRDTANLTSMFLLEIFEQADPTRSGGKETTLRNVVDDAAARALRSPALARMPETKASVLNVLASVYGKMQRIAEGRRLIDAAGSLRVRDPQIRVTTLSVDAYLRLWESDYAGMHKSLDAAFVILNAHPEVDPNQPKFQHLHRATLLSYRAQLAQAEGDSAAAMRDYAEMRRLSLAMSPPDRANVLAALLGEGVAAVDNGEPDRGAPLLRRVIIEREAMGEPLDPQVLTATNTLGVVAAKQGRPIEAERWFRRAERLQLQVYGEASLDVALSRSNLGRALVEQRRFAEAIRVLQPARAAFVAQVGDTVDTLANLEDSLGLARGGAGDTAGARAAFAHGLGVARQHAMPKEVELLADRAELDCRSGQRREGEAGVAGARAALTRFGLPEPWRAARLDSIAAGCLIAAGRQAEARPLITRSLRPILERWGEDSLFGRTARDQARQAGVAGEKTSVPL